MSLQVLHRPKSLKTFAGNDEIKQSLEEILKRKNPPASFLIVGNSGCGKTTLGRIIAKMLGCSKEDYKETNAANDRTLPSIRKIIDDMQYAPMAGKKKVILMDECFSGDTIISTPNGAKRIDSVKIDDAVFNLNGVDVVEKVFANKIPLDRVARINKSNGTFTFCSKDHEYYIDDEWVNAKDLTNRNLAQYKERIPIKMERVESVEIYKRGDNDESFVSIIGDKERDQGYVTFYDLQIKTNHSYIANDNMVHNCHQFRKEVQEALLKALEEPPSHVHFILCTTNPEALKDTLKRRCHIYEVQSLNSNQMMKHLRTILKKEKIKDFKEEILEKIIELSDGSPGIALKYLDMVIDMTDEKEAISLLKSSGTSENDVKQLCQALIDFRVNDKTRWNRVKKILKDFKGDAESARRPILGYLNSCLLNNPVGDNFAIIMDEFKDNFYDSGKAGLSLACFKSCFIIDED
jgi:DNA polymerase III subunit gamma/tau